MTRVRHILAAIAALVLFAASNCSAAVATHTDDISTTGHDDAADASPRRNRVGVDAPGVARGEDATSFELTAEPPRGITVSYPENTGKFSSLYKQSTLLAGDTDYSSIKVQVGDDVLGSQRIKLTVDYKLGRRNEKQKVFVTLPVVEATAPTVEQLTKSVGPITAGSSGWVDVSYKANKPGVTHAQLTAKPPAGATVTYPNDASHSGFAADSTLSVGETDHASFKIDTGTLEPGAYTVELDLVYGNGGQHLRGTVALTVS